MDCNFYTINDDDEGEAFSQINFRDDSDNDDNSDEHTESELRIRTVTSTSTDDNDNDNDKKNTTNKALDIDYGIADQLDADKELDLIDELVRIATGSGETETTEYDRIQSRAVHVVHTVGKNNTDSGTANALNFHLPGISLNDSNDDDDDDDDIVVDQRKLRKESIMYLYDEEEQLELIDIHDDVNDIITTKDEYDGESGGIGCGGCTTGCTKSAKRRMQRGTILYYLSISILIGLIIVLSGVLYKYNTTGISNSNGSSISEVNESSESQVIDIKPYDNSMDVPLDEVQQPSTPSFDTTLVEKNNDTVTVPETSTLSPTNYNTNNDDSSKTSSPTGDTTVDSTTYWWDTNNNGIYDEWEMNVEKQDTNDFTSNSDSDFDSDSAATIPPTSADTIPATIPARDTSTEVPTTYWWDTNSNGIYEEWEMDIKKEDTNTNVIDINSDIDSDTDSAATIPATSADTDSTATDVPSTHWYDTTETELPTDGSNTDVPTSRITTGEEQKEDPINTSSKSNYSNDVIVVDVDTINVVPKKTSRERSGKSGEGNEVRRRQSRTLRTGLRNKVSLTAPVDNSAFIDYVEEENAYANENEELVTSTDAPSSSDAPSSITSSLSSPSSPPSEAPTQSPTSEAPTPSPTYYPTIYDKDQETDEDGDAISDSTTNPTTHWWDNDDGEDGEEDGFTSESIVPTTPWWE